MSDPLARSKKSIDIGYFTANPEPMLAFWREEIGLSYEQPVPFNNGLTQYRHQLGENVIKINTSSAPLNNPDGTYSELLIARSDIETPSTQYDPDGNKLTWVPHGYLGITGLGLRVAVADVAGQHLFYREALGCEALADDRLICGHDVLLLEAGGAATSGHWVSLGLRYFTVHVMRVDDAFAAALAEGGEVGEQPYSIGKIARICFVRDAAGKWIEIAQRASLAGPWWE